MTPIPSHYSLLEVEIQEKGTNTQFLQAALRPGIQPEISPFVHSIFRPVETQPVFSVPPLLQRALFPMSHWFSSESLWKETNIFNILFFFVEIQSNYY